MGKVLPPDQRAEGTGREAWGKTFFPRAALPLTKQASLGLWEPWAHSDSGGPCSPRPPGPLHRARGSPLPCSYSIHTSSCPLAPHRPWGGVAGAVRCVGGERSPCLFSRLSCGTGFFRLDVSPGGQVPKVVPTRIGGQEPSKALGGAGMGVPITLTPLPAPDSSCPYLSLAPPLWAVGYPALPPGLTRPAAPTGPARPAAGLAG